jgi:hypothetical protein
MRGLPIGKIPDFKEPILVKYFNVLCQSRQIDNCQLPAFYGCGVKRRQGAVLIGAAPPEPAR